MNSEIKPGILVRLTHSEILKYLPLEIRNRMLAESIDHMVDTPGFLEEYERDLV